MMISLNNNGSASHRMENVKSPLINGVNSNNFIIKNIKSNKAQANSQSRGRQASPIDISQTKPIFGNT